MLKKIKNWWDNLFHDCLDEDYEKLVAWWKVNYAALDWSGDEGGHPTVPVEASEMAQEPPKQPSLGSPSLGPCQKHQEASDAFCGCNVPDPCRGTKCPDKA